MVCYKCTLYIMQEKLIQKPIQVHTAAMQSYSSKVTKLNATIRSRELTTTAPLPITSGRWQQGTGGLFGLQLSGAR